MILLQDQLPTVVSLHLERPSYTEHRLIIPAPTHSAPPASTPAPPPPTTTDIIRGRATAADLVLTDARLDAYVRLGDARRQTDTSQQSQQSQAVAWPSAQSILLDYTDLSQSLLRVDMYHGTVRPDWGIRDVGHGDGSAISMTDLLASLRARTSTEGTITMQDVLQVLSGKALISQTAFGLATFLWATQFARDRGAIEEIWRRNLFVVGAGQWARTDDLL